MTERPTDIPPGTRAPGYSRAPAHRVAFVPLHARVTIRADGLQIGATADVVALEENGYPPRYYLARDGIDMARLEKTEKTAYCPFKGIATYYDGTQGEIHDAVWLGRYDVTALLGEGGMGQVYRPPTRSWAAMSR